MSGKFNRAKLLKIAETAIKIIIVLAGCWILYVKIIENQDFTEMWNNIKSSFSSPKGILLMTAALLLIPVNIAFEAMKWKKSIQPIENVPFSKAFTAIFTGITAGMFFPNRTGDFLGRIFILEKGNRIKAAMLTFVGNIAQMIVTVSLGCFACVFFAGRFRWLVLLAATIVLGLLLVLFFNIKIFRYLRIFVPKKWREKTDGYMGVFNMFSRKELLTILLLAFAKYMVYSLQFVILIWAFGIPLSYFNSMIPIMVTYLLMTVIPFITITEIAVRGSVCIVVFEKWLAINAISSSWSMMVFSASTILWLYNLAIPAVVGLFFINRLKFLRRSYDV
ncbi:MAG: lysylphosphatidylglycerol synthase domain-containing protein [Bacteroidales bacterium]|nr:lysylphosphatidylglycerol synthase domain-containing protein [Bacteroidales bacterium]